MFFSLRRQKEEANRKRREEWEENGVAQKTDGTAEVLLHETAESVEYRKKKKDKKKPAACGWDVFNQDTYHSAYKKRLDKLPPVADANASASIRDADSLDYNKQPDVLPDRVDMMVQELKET